MAIKSQQFIPATGIFLSSFSLSYTFPFVMSVLVLLVTNALAILLHSLHVYRIKCDERHLINWVKIHILLLLSFFFHSFFGCERCVGIRRENTQAGNWVCARRKYSGLIYQLLSFYFNNSTHKQKKQLWYISDIRSNANKRIERVFYWL